MPPAPQRHPKDPTASNLCPEALRAACDVCPCSVMVTDASGRIEYVNGAFERLNGFSAAEALGQNPRILKSGEHPPEFYAEMWRTLSSGDTWTGRIKNRRKDGSLYWADVTVRPVRGEGGEIAHYVSASHNISRGVVAGESAEQFFEQPMTLNIIVTLDGVIRLVNGAWERTLGYSRKELEGRPFMDFVHPDDREPTRRQMAELAQGANVLGFENRYRHKDGVYRTLAWAARVSKEDGLIYALATDITGRKEAEAALRDIDARYHDLIRRIPIGVYTLRLEAGGTLRFDYVSERLCRMTGVAEQDALRDPETVFSKVHPDDRPSFDAANRAAIEKGRFFSWDGRCEVGGRMGWIRLESEPTAFPGGDMVWNGVVIDVSERMRASAELQKSKDLLEATGRMAKVGGWEIDLPSHKLTWSDNTCALFEVPPGYALTVEEALENFCLPERRTLLAKAVGAAIEHGTPWDLDLPLVSATGRHFWGRLLGRPKVVGGKTVQLQGTFQDITTQKTLEHNLQAALDRAEAAGRTKSDFLAVMSHELRTPLNGVLGFSELLAQTALDQEQKDYADTIRESGNQLLRIVNDILDFSSFERGTVGLQQAPFSLSAMVESSAEKLRASATAKGLDYRWEISPQSPATIVGDERRIGQILVNLVANAIKFTERGRVSLRVAPAADGGRRFLDFAVADTGIGISPETLASLFRPFTQADTSSKRSFGGIGLGLAIARRLAEAMGGRISVESNPGNGSTFTLHIPLEPEHPSTMPNIDQPSSPASGTAPGKLVLLVEDDDSNSRLAGKMLQLLGYGVDFAPHGVAAVKAFAPGKYAAILMDVRMPLMDGIEATKKIREIEAPAGTRVPIIALTANAMPGDREICLGAGMDEFHSKPFRKDELAAKLDALIGRPR